MHIIIFFIELIILSVGLLLTSFVAYMWAMEFHHKIVRVIIYALYWVIILPPAIMVGQENSSFLITVLSLVQYNVIAFVLLLLMMKVSSVYRNQL